MLQASEACVLRKHKIASARAVANYCHLWLRNETKHFVVAPAGFKTEQTRCPHSPSQARLCVTHTFLVLIMIAGCHRNVQRAGLLWPPTTIEEHDLHTHASACPLVPWPCAAPRWHCWMWSKAVCFVRQGQHEVQPNVVNRPARVMFCMWRGVSVPS